MENFQNTQNEQMTNILPQKFHFVWQKNFALIDYKTVYTDVILEEAIIKAVRTRATFWVKHTPEVINIPFNEIKSINISKKYGIYDLIYGTIFAIVTLIFLINGNSRWIFTGIMTALFFFSGLCAKIEILTNMGIKYDIPVGSMNEGEAFMQAFNLLKDNQTEV